VFTVLPRMIAESQMVARQNGTAHADEAEQNPGEDLGSLELGAGKLVDYSVDFSQQALDAEVDPLAGLLDDGQEEGALEQSPGPVRSAPGEGPGRSAPGEVPQPDPEHDIDRLLDSREASRPGLARPADAEVDSSSDDSDSSSEDEGEKDDDAATAQPGTQRQSQMAETMDRMAKAVSSGDKTAGSMPRKRATVRDHLAIMAEEFGVQLDAQNVQPFQANKLMPHKVRA